MAQSMKLLQDFWVLLRLPFIIKMTTLSLISISLCRLGCFPKITPYANKTRARELTFISQTTWSARRSTNSMSESISERGEILPEDVLVQYVVLRRDLIDTWPMGSVVTQGCHASVSAIWENKDDPHTLQYCSPQNIDSMRKVTLEVKGEVQMWKLAEKLTAAGIAHKLWIEQPENIPTCLATKPYPKSVVALFFNKLKLCK